MIKSGINREDRNASFSGAMPFEDAKPIHGKSAVKPVQSSRVRNPLAYSWLNQAVASVILLLMLTACTTNSSIESEYYFLNEKQNLNIKLGDSVDPGIGNSVYVVSRAEYPDTRVYRDTIEIDACNKNIQCDYIVKYDCRYNCWGSGENRLCGIKVIMDGSGDFRVKESGLVGLQIEC